MAYVCTEDMSNTLCTKQTNNSVFFVFPILLVLYEIAVYLSNDAYLPALPDIARDLKTSHHLIQLTLTTWFMGSMSMPWLLGPISDRYGRRPVLLIGAIIFVVTTLVCALTHNINILVVARFIQGATVTSMIVAGYACIHELFEHERAIHTLAWMNSITVLAPSFGPLFGAVVLYFANWRWIFGILAIWGILTLFGLLFKMPETNLKENRHPLQLQVVTKQYVRILLNSNYMRNLISFGLLYGALIAWIVAGPFLVITEFHRSAFDFGVFQAIIFGSLIIATRMVKPFMRKYSTLLLVRVGLTLALCGGVAAILFAAIFPNALIGLILSLVFIASGSGLCFPILNRLTIESSEEPMGARMAILSTLLSGFGVLSSAAISYVYNGSLISLAAVLTVATVVAFMVKGLKS